MATFRRGPFILMFAVDRQLGALLADAFADAPLTPSDFAVTSALRLAGPVRPSVLAASLGMRQTTLSNYVRHLGDAGYIKRRRDPDDGRAVLISLTTKGVRRTEACFPAFGAVIDTFQRQIAVQGIDNDEMIAILEEISSALDATAAELGFI